MTVNIEKVPQSNHVKNTTGLAFQPNISEFKCSSGFTFSTSTGINKITIHNYFQVNQSQMFFLLIYTKNDVPKKMFQANNWGIDFEVICVTYLYG